MSHMYWTMFQVFPSGMQKFITMLFPFSILWTSILQGTNPSSFFLRWWLLGFEKHQVLLNNNNFKIHLKFVVVNNMHYINHEFIDKNKPSFELHHGFQCPHEFHINISLVLSITNFHEHGPSTWAREWEFCFFKGSPRYIAFKMMMCYIIEPFKILW